MKETVVDLWTGQMCSVERPGVTTAAIVPSGAATASHAIPAEEAVVSSTVASD